MAGLKLSMTNNTETINGTKESAVGRPNFRAILFAANKPRVMVTMLVAKFQELKMVRTNARKKK